MALDQTTEAFLKNLTEQEGPAFHELPPEKCRELFTGLCVSLQGDVVEMESVSNQTIDGPNGEIPIRIYNPNKSQEKLPLIVLFHGGGWVIGDLESHDNMCRYLAKSCEAILVAVDYRLAPENKFPSAIEDALDSVNYIFNNSKNLNFNNKKVVLCGDSAGGNLAFLMSIYAKKKMIPSFLGQILIYPWVDLTMSRPSMNIKLDGILVEKETLLYFSKHYLNKSEEKVDWRVSPILYPDLSNLPPTFIFSAGIDPLVDEGDALKKRLLSFGNEVHYKLYPGQMHAFASNIVNLPTAMDCIDEASIAIKQLYNRT